MTEPIDAGASSRRPAAVSASGLISSPLAGALRTRRIPPAGIGGGQNRSPIQAGDWRPVRHSSPYRGAFTRSCRLVGHVDCPPDPQPESCGVWPWRRSWLRRSVRKCGASHLRGRRPQRLFELQGGLGVRPPTRVVVSTLVAVTLITMVLGSGMDSANAEVMGVLHSVGQEAQSAVVTPLPWGNTFSPNPSKTSRLSGVSCSNSTNCVAVGVYGNDTPPGTPPNKTLVESWNGAIWSVVPSPNPDDSSDNLLNAVFCTSSTDCMAVGSDGGSLWSNLGTAPAWL